MIIYIYTNIKDFYHFIMNAESDLKLIGGKVYKDDVLIAEFRRER